MYIFSFFLNTILVPVFRSVPVFVLYDSTHFKGILIEKQAQGKKKMIKFDKLFKIFEERGITQYHLYTYRGISRSQFQRLKTGNVNVNTLNNILNILEDCTLDDICEFVPDPPKDKKKEEE